MRFVQRRTFGEIGSALSLSDEAARKRVDRALEKLRGVLARRGILCSAAALSGTLAHAVTTAPGGLAASVAGHALAAKQVISLVSGDCRQEEVNISLRASYHRSTLAQVVLALRSRPPFHRHGLAFRAEPSGSDDSFQSASSRRCSGFRLHDNHRCLLGRPRE
jgi:DNA-binding Lrp family transcriptional regulator